MADAQYLQETVGPALTAGLASVAAAQPDDPVDYLAHWLLKYLAIEEKKQKVLLSPCMHGMLRIPNTMPSTQTAEAEKLLQAEKDAADAAEVAKSTAKDEKFLLFNKAAQDVAASTSLQQMYNLTIKAVRLIHAS